MKLNFIFIVGCALLAAPAVLGSARAAPVAEDPALAQLRETVAELRRELEAQRAAGPSDGGRAELERRIDLLAVEIERLRTAGAVGEEPTPEGRKGLAPAASKVYRKAHGVSLGGYGEALYTNVAASRQDGTPSGRGSSVDYLRQVLYVGYKFSDKVLLNSELELEHAKVGEGGGGELALEFAYLELQPRRAIGLRAGLLLVPLGFLNELHEPPVFRGARRPLVETVIIPSTWRENGLGLFGEAGPLQWRAYAVAGLSSAGFSAQGLRGGRQEGSLSSANDLGFTGRVDLGGRGLLAGGSFFTGKSGQGARVGGRELAARVTLLDLHAQYERAGLRLRGLWARSTLADAARVNEQNGLTGGASVGGAQSGWYLEASYDLLTLVARSRWSLTPYLRYERLDTQQRVPAGYDRDPGRAQDVLAGGLELKPLPQVVFKLDYQRLHDGARQGTSQWQLALGYLF